MASDTYDPSEPNDHVLRFLSRRRSVKAALLEAPGPDRAALDTILTLATRVPDHKKLAPWRFVVFEGPARERMGEVLARACLEEEDATASEVRLSAE